MELYPSMVEKFMLKAEYGKGATFIVEIPVTEQQIQKSKSIVV